MINLDYNGLVKKKDMDVRIHKYVKTG